jgi:hypothetical protein
MTAAKPFGILVEGWGEGGGGDRSAPPNPTPAGQERPDLGAPESLDHRKAKA